jgi:hypothetical protein
MLSGHQSIYRERALKRRMARASSWSLCRLSPLSRVAACYFVGGFSPAEFLFAFSGAGAAMACGSVGFH